MKKCIALVVLLFASFPLFAQQASGDQTITNRVINNGVGLGAVIAVVTSWSRNRSVLWAILHGIFGWLYVIYFVLSRQDNE